MSAQRLSDFLAAANRIVETVAATDATALAGRPDVLLVDLRDDGERRRTGVIPGALHLPRGGLEFYIDPESPFHKPELATGRKILFFCAGGGRSALAAKTALDMGLTAVAHIGGGYAAWVEAGGATGKHDSA